MRKLGFSVAFLLAFGASPASVNTASAQSLEDEQAAMEGDDSDDGGGGLGSPSGDDGTGSDGTGSDGSGSDGGGAAASPSDDETPERLDDEQAEMADEETTEEFRDTTDPFEAENTDYFFLGAFGRGIIIPGFIQSLFVDGGIDGFNPGTGLMFNWRRNQFNVIAQLWWNNASADGFFRASGDPRRETEYIDVDLGVVFINAAFLWAVPITDWFAFEIGFDLGVGFIYGDLVRTEAYESSVGADDFQACSGPGADGALGYCEPAIPPSSPCYDTSGGHYNCREPNWTTEGGDTPLVFPWVTLPHIALRFKPIHQFQIRVDGGYGLYNFFFGGSVAYGF